MTEAQQEPAMTVVLVTPDCYETVRKTIRHLQAQTVRDRLEVLLVAPSARDLGLDESSMRDFFRYRVLEVGEIDRPARAKIVAIRQATAPIVAFAEDHCYPDPNWAAALIAAHERGFAAVGPVMRNANPGTMLSWAGLLVHYGYCLEPTSGRVVENLPWHNVSYKRELLWEFGDALPSLLAVEGVLLDDLRAKGHRLYLEPAAKTDHVNISRWAPWIEHAFLGGRLFGAARAREKRWPLWRRLVYIGGAPLIPLVRLRRTLRLVRHTGRSDLMPRILPALMSGLIAHAFGELTGYAMGSGRTEQQYSIYEMARTRHVTAGDRHILTD